MPLGELTVAVPLARLSPDPDQSVEGVGRSVAVRRSRSWPYHLRMSWDEAFGSRYEEWSAHMTADVAFYVDLAQRADGPLVELAIGNGRVAIPVAQSTGRRVAGIDSSPAMLEQARVRAAEAGVELDLRQSDMRALALDEPAALIYCPFRALLRLPTWSDRCRTFERVAASIRPDGCFAWNAFAFDHRIAARLDGEHQEELVPHTVRYSVGAKSDRHITRRRRAELPLVGDEERVARAPRCRRTRAAGALFRVFRSRMPITARNMCSSPAGDTAIERRT